jgi:hypothetical protein
VTPRLSVLALDHFFDQDLRALEAHPRLDVRRFPYQRLRNPAIRIMGKGVTAGLRGYNDPALATQRDRYATWLAREVRRLYLERPFDLIVLPSDAFFYVRSLPAAAHRLGVPVVVVQKETTVSQATMEVFSQEVGTQAPFVSDFMTVCSDRQREFWIRAGAPEDRIEVTGQPRFDLYAAATDPGVSRRRRVLFLTYMLDAYVPGGRGLGLRPWEPLRRATETVLLERVHAGADEVVVKCHPQQDRRAEETRLEAFSGAAWNHGWRLASQDADTRELIIASDIVVGFQTTALCEAVAARRRVIYAAWGKEYERYRDGLIRFDAAPAECVSHATSPELLATMLMDVPTPHGVVCAPWYEEALGRVDGRATERVADRITSVAGAWAPTEERVALSQRRRQFAMGLLLRSIAAEAVWTAAIPVAQVTHEEQRVAVRRRRARASRALATATLRGVEQVPRDATRGGG